MRVNRVAAVTIVRADEPATVTRAATVTEPVAATEQQRWAATVTATEKLRSPSQ